MSDENLKVLASGNGSSRHTLKEPIKNFVGEVDHPKPDMYKESFTDDTKEGIGLTMKSVAEQTKPNNPISIGNAAVGLFDKISNEIDEMTYLEMRELQNQLKNELESIKSTLQMADSFTSLAGSMAGMAEDPLRAKMEVSKFLGDQTLAEYRIEGRAMVRELEQSLDLINRTLDAQYKDVVVTSSFFSDQMVLSLGRKIREAKENKKGLPNDAVQASIELLTKYSVMYGDRMHLWNYMDEYLLKPYGKYIRKAKQFCRNMPDKTFDGTKSALSRAFDEKRMAALEYFLIGAWENPNTIVPFFTFLSMIMEKRNSSNEYALAHTFVTLLIMNAGDIISKIWDFDVTPEEYTDHFRDLEDIFTIIK